MRTIAIIGSRSFPLDMVDYFLDRDLRGYDRIVSGGARGVDQRAEFIASEHGLTVLSYRPRPSVRQGIGGSFVIVRYVDDKYERQIGNSHGPLRFGSFGQAAKARNWMIVGDDDPERIIAFWDGTSSGTAHGIAAATRLGRPVTIHMDGDS